MRADGFRKSPRAYSASLVLGCGLWVLSCATAPTPQPTQPIADYFRTRSIQTDFSGAVWVEAKGSVVLKQAYGSADRELDVPLTVDSIFRIGSLTKPITATAVLMLAEQGQLGIADSVCTFVAHCPDTWRTATVRTLLNHTSGIPDLFGHLEAVPVEQTVQEVDAVLSGTRVPDLISEPGTRFSYSNFNYVLLGYLIERVTGRYWEDFLVESVFAPLSMNRTRYDDVWELVPGRSHGYTVADGKVAKIEYDDHAAYAAGGLRSTLENLARWHRAYVDDRLISQRSREEATSAVLGNYGLGWQILTMFGRLMYNHSGGIDGFASHLAYYPEEELLIVVLSNSDREDAKATACDVAALYFKAQPAPTGSRSWLNTSRSQRCVTSD